MDKMTYEEAMNKLEAIVRKIDSGEMNIDDLTEQLKLAKELISYCKQKLTDVESDVQKILGQPS